MVVVSCLLSGTTYLTSPIVDVTRKGVLEKILSDPNKPKHPLIPGNVKISELGNPDDSSGRIFRTYLDYPQQILLLTLHKMNLTHSEYSSWFIPLSVMTHLIIVINGCVFSKDCKWDNDLPFNWTLRITPWQNSAWSSSRNSESIGKCVNSNKFHGYDNAVRFCRI